MHKNLKKRYLKELAKNIKTARKQAGLSQKELAILLQKRTRYVTIIERARLDLRFDQIYKIHKYLKVDLGLLLNFSKIKKHFNNCADPQRGPQKAGNSVQRRQKFIKGIILFTIVYDMCKIFYFSIMINPC